MTKRDAEEQGLHFTGVYDWDRVKVKEQMDKYRRLNPGAKFYFITVPKNPLSRGPHGTGYSIYSNVKYNDIVRQEQVQKADTANMDESLLGRICRALT